MILDNVSEHWQSLSQARARGYSERPRNSIWGKVESPQLYYIELYSLGEKITIQCAKTLRSIMLAGLVFASPAWANGDLFFEAAEIPGKPVYVIFGNVKDDRGRYIESATVTVKVAEPRLAYTSQTGILGRFRTLDIGRAIQGLGYEVDPSQIEVTIEFPGYHVVRRLHRGKRGQNKGAIEMNFVLEKEAD